MSVALPGERLAFTLVMVPLQEEERKEEQLCGADDAGYGGRRRNEPTAGGEEDHSWRGVGQDCQFLGQDRLRKGRGFARFSLATGEACFSSISEQKLKIDPSPC